MFILLWLHKSINCFDFVDKLQKYDIAAIPAAPFYVGGEGRNVIRLYFSLAPVNLIDEGIKRMAKLHKELTVS